jgi:hypothetical protein
MLGSGVILADQPVLTSQHKLQLLMEQARLRAASSTANAPAAQTSPSPERLQERSQLLAIAEAALFGGDTANAQQAFERAALISHAADTEMGLVRTHMQAGQYRRALSFGAHTAGAHLDVVGGAALYAWLLQIGGQETIAKRMLAEALTRAPQHPILIATQKQLLSCSPLANGLLLHAPVRMAPYGPHPGIATGARVTGTGLLFDSGKRVLVPLATLGKAQRLWVRNGLGQLTPARLIKTYSRLNLAVLVLGGGLPMDAPLPLAARDAFAGSVAYAVEYAPAPSATPQWPILNTGFLGEQSADGQTRALGITLAKGPRGGPVFDNMGRLVGMAVASRFGADQLVTTSQLVSILGQPVGQLTAAADLQRMPVDQVYESALQTTVQIIATP